MRKTKILIVEDELIFAHEMELWLKDAGYEIVGITSQGSKALDWAVSFKPDIVIMDVQLKGRIDGIQAALQMKEKIDINVIFLTGNPDLHNTLKQTSLKPVSIITKPVSQYKLLDILKSVKK